MNQTQELEIDKDLVRWSRQRWVFAVLFIFALQAGGIYWASRGEGEGAPMPRAMARVMLGNTPKAEMLAAPAVDPLLFASADIAGFSGEGWLQPRPWNYQTDGLGKRAEYLRYADGARIIEKPVPPRKIHNLAGAPIFSTGPVRAEPVEPRAPGQSQLRVEGELRQRTLAAVPELPLQRANDVLNNSIVEVGVTADGLVVSARLLERSRSKTADQQALALARNIRFQPAASANSEVTWGKLIFQWFAVNLTGTNAAPR